MALYRRMIVRQNRRILAAMDTVQAEATATGLSEAVMDELLEQENPS